MASNPQEQFLAKAWAAAAAAGHPWPAFAACEAALESGWGLSRLAEEANNLFGQKQSSPSLPGTATIALPTREYLSGAWVVVQAAWVQFPSWAACFQARINLLRRLAPEYPSYAAALAATSGTAYVDAVSRSWSTDPQRAAKVLAVYDAHQAFLEGLPTQGQPSAAPTESA